MNSDAASTLLLEIEKERGKTEKLQTGTFWRANCLPFVRNKMRQYTNFWLGDWLRSGKVSIRNVTCPCIKLIEQVYWENVVTNMNYPAITQFNRIISPVTRSFDDTTWTRNLIKWIRQKLNECTKEKGSVTTMRWILHEVAHHTPNNKSFCHWWWECIQSDKHNFDVFFHE